MISSWPPGPVLEMRMEPSASTNTCCASSPSDHSRSPSRISIRRSERADSRRSASGMPSRSAACFAPDLAQSVAFGDDRYRQLCQLLRDQLPAAGYKVPELPEPPTFKADSSRELDLDAVGAVIFTSGFPARLRPLGSPAGLRRMGLPADGGWHQHGRARPLLRRRPLPAQTEVVAHARCRRRRRGSRPPHR